MITSFSDDGVYPQFCKAAAEKEELFRSFRRNEIYCGIVETVNFQDGKSYLELLLKKRPEYKKYLNTFSKNDTIGDPLVFRYKHGFFSLKRSYFSPTTLRYVNTLADLETFFENLDGFNIVEIGAGYGGLCRIISERFNFKSYSIIDLQPGLSIAKKYLNSFDVKNVSYFTPEDVKALDKKYDLLISNYAFSEVNREWQEIYFSQILQNSSRGYMLCNFFSHTWDKNQYSEQELLKLIQGSYAIKDVPILSNGDIGNKISLMVWES